MMLAGILATLMVLAYTAAAPMMLAGGANDA